MATPPALSALVRAYRPQFRQPHDKVVFAVHAVLSLNGYKLVAVGPAAEQAGEEVRRREDESPLDGWNDQATSEQGGVYTLMYALPPPASQQSVAAPTADTATPALLVRGVVLGDQVVVNFMADPCPANQAPTSLQLDVERYAGSDAATSTSYAYSNVDELIQQVQTAANTQTSPAASPSSVGAAAQGGSAAKAGSSTSAASHQLSHRDAQGRSGREPEVEDPLRDYSQPARRPVPLPGHNPLSVGDEDMMPGLLPGGRHQFDPFQGPGHGGFGAGGGMHMGPGHPAFTGGGMLPGMRGGPRPGQMGGGPGPGIRWDPIRPPGLPGFNPEDFTRDGRGPPGQIHPDLMQPGPGRGPDWDEMFG